MPDMPDSGVDESQVENNENIEKYRPSSILLKKVFRESWKLKLKVEKWKSESVCEHKRTEHVKKQQ